MLAKRIIPCLDIKNGRVVKGVKFLGLKDAGDPVQVAERYEKEGADELVYLDITASHEQRSILFDLVNKTASNVFMPLTVGGGVKTVEDIKKLLRVGADKVSINTAAVLNPKLVNNGAKRFGTQCIVVAIDAKKTNKGKWEVYIHGGRTKTGLDATKWAKKVEYLGAGEILLTSMDRDGTQDGYDLSLTKAISSAVNIPIIASGGAGYLSHFYDGLVKGQADAVLAASLFHYKKLTISQVKKYLKKRKVNVRC